MRETGMQDGDYTREVLDALRTRCLNLQTKEAFLGIPEAHERPMGDDEGIFWCELTDGMLGPDGNDVCAKACGKPGRSCYEGPVQL